MFEARKVAGSATVKQYETVLSFKVSLFIQFKQTDLQTEDSLFMLINISSPKLQSAPLIMHLLFWAMFPEVTETLTFYL